jgi:hypothetical protein
MWLATLHSHLCYWSVPYELPWNISPPQHHVWIIRGMEHNRKFEPHEGKPLALISVCLSSWMKPLEAWEELAILLSTSSSSWYSCFSGETKVGNRREFKGIIRIIWWNGAFRQQLNNFSWSRNSLLLNLKMAEQLYYNNESNLGIKIVKLSLCLTN